VHEAQQLENSHAHKQWRHHFKSDSGRGMGTRLLQTCHEQNLQELTTIILEYVVDAVGRGMPNVNYFLTSVTTTF
jgi:hypothetical protein